MCAGRSVWIARDVALWPDTFGGLLQLVYLTACAMLQTAILFGLAWLARRRDN
jgi:hypothetical protein